MTKRNGSLLFSVERRTVESRMPKLEYRKKAQNPRPAAARLRRSGTPVSVGGEDAVEFSLQGRVVRVSLDCEMKLARPRFECDARAFRAAAQRERKGAVVNLQRRKHSRQPRAANYQECWQCAIVGEFGDRTRRAHQSFGQRALCQRSQAHIFVERARRRTAGEACSSTKIDSGYRH